MGIFAVIAQSQSPKFVNPSEGSLAGKPLIINGLIKQTLASAFDVLLIALVLSHIRNQTMIETNFTRIAGVESTIGVEKCSRNAYPQAFDIFERNLEMRFQIKSIMPISGDDAAAGENEAIGIAHGQNITGLRPFTMLINDTFITFFSDSIRAIKVQVGAIQLIFDSGQALLPNMLKTACCIPFLPVILNR